MMSLVRSGPTIISVTQRDSQDSSLVDYVKGISYMPSHSVVESYENAGECDTLIVFDDDGHGELSVYQTITSTPQLLCEVINRGLAGCVTQVRVTPPNIVMRLIGNMDAAIDQIARDFNAVESSHLELALNMDEQSVLVNFTSEPLNKNMHSLMFHKRALLISKPYGQLMEYLNIALGKPDWNEIEITLFDAMDQFNLHYKRLITVLQGLDVGVIMGEDWVAEYTVALRKSEVYQIRLLTPLSSREIKRIALALEYDPDGRRLADFDVYVNKKKIGWSTERQLDKGYTRDEIGVIHMRRLMSTLPAEAKAMLLKLNAEIDRSGPLKR